MDALTAEGNGDKGQADRSCRQAVKHLEPRKTSSTPAVVQGAAPALAKAGVGGYYIYIYTYQGLAGNHSLVTKGTIHVLRILPICDMQVDYCAPNSWRNSVFSWCFFANKDCSCLKRCLWDKFDRMRLATTPRSVCWIRVANGNVLYTFSSVCPNDRSLPTSSATTRPSVHWKGVSNGRVLCSCSDLWKRLTSNQPWWATTAASLAATVLGSGKPPWTSLRRCNRRQFHQMLWWTSWCHFMPFQYNIFDPALDDTEFQEQFLFSLVTYFID